MSTSIRLTSPAKSRQGRFETVEEIVEVRPLLSTEDLSKRFFCMRRAKELSEATCFNWFCDAHAMREKKNPCWECRQGAAVRVGYAFDAEVSVETVDACINICATRSPLAKSYRVLKISNAV